jgi:hypothetical protein
VGGGAAAVKYAPQYGVSGPWTLATLFGGLLGLFLLARFKKGAWKSIRLHGGDEPAGSQVRSDSATVSTFTLTAEP